MAIGRRCDIGCATWPDQMIYSTCPICGEHAERWKDVEPMSEAEAQSIKLQHEFDSYYAKRCQRVGIEPDGPLPPEYERSLPTPSSLLG